MHKHAPHNQTARTTTKTLFDIVFCPLWIFRNICIVIKTADSVLLDGSSKKKIVSAALINLTSRQPQPQNHKLYKVVLLELSPRLQNRHTYLQFAKSIIGSLLNIAVFLKQCCLCFTSYLKPKKFTYMTRSSQSDVVPNHSRCSTMHILQITHTVW